MDINSSFNRILEKHQKLSDKLASGELATDEFIKTSKEFAEIEELAEKIKIFVSAQKELADLKLMMEDASLDKEMRDLSEEEYYQLKKDLATQEKAIRIAMLPKDEADSKNAILEIRAGTGGDEAALFAANLFRMYQRYAELNKWRFEVNSISDTGVGGYKEASAIISGTDVFAKMKFESGVHRVQRVPETESSGRVHTSAATVAVLPEAEEVDIIIEDKDLKIDTFRASGAGGQHVNTTDSAVRITHIPTGTVVSQQDEKSQHKNKAKALKILRSRIYEHERQKASAERAASRKGQIGSGDRSERIRTYNYPQGRVTDHRINLTLYKINEITNHGELDELVSALREADEAAKLAEQG